MAILSKEQILNSADLETKVFESKVWGGEIKYRHPSVGDKSRARKMAMLPNDKGEMEVDNERLEVGLIIACCIEPKFAELDIEKLMERNGNEVKRLVNCILGSAANPQK
jgi:hypothetical protein